jgi:hypothetical protein
LTHDNFLLRQAQILPYLHSQRLIGFVTGATPCPKSTIPTADKDAAPVPNPTYDLWFEQDQAILSAILLSLSPEVLSQCLFFKTSKEVWDKLNGLYATQSRASATQIRMQLANLKKSDLSVVDYNNRIKSLTDIFVAAGAPLRDDEIIVYLLTGILEEYDLLVTSATTRAKPMSLYDVYTNLINFENHLLCHTGGTGPVGGPGANFASRSSRGGCHPSSRSGGVIPDFMPKSSTHRMHDPGSFVPHIWPKVLTDNQIS